MDNYMIENIQWAISLLVAFSMFAAWQFIVMTICLYKGIDDGEFVGMTGIVSFIVLLSLINYVIEKFFDNEFNNY